MFERIINYHDEYISFHNSGRELDLEQMAKPKLIFISNYKKEISYKTFIRDFRVNVLYCDVNWANLLIKKKNPQVNIKYPHNDPR